MYLTLLTQNKKIGIPGVNAVSSALQLQVSELVDFVARILWYFPVSVFLSIVWLFMAFIVKKSCCCVYCIRVYF